MPTSRKRAAQHTHHKSPALHAKQHNEAKITWAILIGCFGLLIAYFAAGNNALALAIGALLGALAGYFIGKSLEKDTVRH